MQMQYICQMNCLHWLDIKGCSYAESKKLRKDKVNPAELAASKPLASEQASEDVVGGANTTFGGATRALGARRRFQLGVCFIALICPYRTRLTEPKTAPDAVVLATARRQALLKNRGRTRLPTRSCTQAASGQEANRPPDAPSIDNSQQRRHRHADALGS